MQAEVDMSGRIEETNRPTALALANDLSDSILISARDKRIVIEALKKMKPERERKQIHILIFSTLLYLLLRDQLAKEGVVLIDSEYPGYEAVIKNRVMSLCHNEGIHVDKDRISFGQVGKKSAAHMLAYSIYRGNMRPDRTILPEDILRVFRK
jgi:hypothetical protein